MIQSLIDEGVQRFDMGQAIDYKVHWAEINLVSDTILLRPKIC